MSKAQVNGVTSSGSVSTTLDHFTSYPLVHDLISYYKSFPLGARSIELSQNIYDSYGKPVLSWPIVQTPSSYVYPYAKKADELGDNTLSTIDANFPAIKETDFGKVKSFASSAINYPFKLAFDGKDYVFSTYSDEANKVGGTGLVHAGKAVVSTEIRIASEALHTVADWIAPKRDAALEQLGQLKSIAADKTAKAKKTAAAKKDEAAKEVHQ